MQERPARQLKRAMTFGYGSKRDLDVLRLDLFGEAAEEIVTYLTGKYPDLQYEEAAD